MPKIITRSEARAMGMTRFYSGDECPSGHVTERMVSNGRCIECHRQSQRSWASRNRETQAALSEAWRRANKDRVRSLERARYAANADEERARAREKSRARRLTQPEAVQAAKLRFRLANRQSLNAAERNRNAAKRASAGQHTAEDVMQIKAEQRNRCAYCRVSLTAFHVDHIKALSRGGSNGRENIQVLCPTCNLRKHARDPMDFARELGMLL